METEKVIVDGKEEEIVLNLDSEYKNDMVIDDVNLDDTLELSVDEINDALENTLILDLNGVRNEE